MFKIQRRPRGGLSLPFSIRAILAHLGGPTTPPLLAPRARAPPWDPTAPPPDPGYPFDQTLN